MCRVCVWYVYKCVCTYIKIKREQDLGPFLGFQLGTLMEEHRETQLVLGELGLRSELILKCQAIINISKTV